MQEVTSSLVSLGLQTSDLYQNIVHRVGTIFGPTFAPLAKQLTQYIPKDVWDWLQVRQSVHSKKLPLMNPIHVIILIGLYLTVIFVGKPIMNRLNPLSLKTFSMLHNLHLLTLSFIMCTSIWSEAWRNKYGLFGNGVDEKNSGWTMARLVWLFYVSKIPEFVDTFIMLLKKNFRQISFLHVYHHGSIFFIWWLVTYMAPTGEAYYSAALNSFIHVVMYGYYFFSALGFKQVSMIKKYITMMQMTQFMTMMIQATYDLYLSSTNGWKGPAYPSELSGLLWIYMVSMLGLFYNFFKQDRRREKVKSK